MTTHDIILTIPAATIDRALTAAMRDSLDHGDLYRAVRRVAEDILSEPTTRHAMVEAIRACVLERLPGIVEEVTCEALRARVAKVVKEQAKAGQLLPLGEREETT